MGICRRSIRRSEWSKNFGIGVRCEGLIENVKMLDTHGHCSMK
jgi:hypothetical protein